MKNTLGSLVLVLLFAGLILFLNPVLRSFSPKETAKHTPPKKLLPSKSALPSLTPHLKAFYPPLNRASERTTKKKFGTYISPANSPVQPERFQGYHTGVDFEAFPDELSSAVKVYTVCSGPLVLKEYTSGYGGVVVQKCQLEGSSITVVYGHLNINSVTFGIDENIAGGKVLGELGANHSPETDGERKHLHLGFHSGETINLLGYVNSEQELSEWIDPCLYVCDQ